MAPLTSPSGCVSCSQLADKIVELEGRISTLYQIQEAERLMDTITFNPAHTKAGKIKFEFRIFLEYGKKLYIRT